jgi:hypothetical protein
MKILQFSSACAFFFFSGISAGFFSSERDVNSEVQQGIEAISKENDLITQISKMRTLIAKNRKNTFNSTTQNIFGNTLQDIFNKRDKQDFHQGKILSSVLSGAVASPLLSKNQQEYVKNTMLPELKKSGCFSSKAKILGTLRNLEKSNNFYIRNRMLMNLSRHHGVKLVESEVQTLFAKVLKETYAMRPLNDENRLGHLKQLLDDVVDSTLLNETDKKYVKTVMLPDIAKNIEVVKMAPASKVFGQMKDISAAYFKNTKKDFDVTKNKSVPGPVLVA